MKKILTYLLLSSVSLPFLSAPANADTPTNIFVDILDGKIDPNPVAAEDSCGFFFLPGFDSYDRNCTKFGIGPAIDQNHQNIISNYNDIQTNSTDTSTNTSNISTNTSNISTNTSNISTNTSNISTNTSNISTNTSDISTNTSNISTNTSDISTNTSNISTNTSDISTNASAIETLQGSSNSADITANTNKINTNTSNINSLGEGVAGSTALTAALSALPQMSKESKTTCGVGTGAYSSRYAVGFGCASKVNERVDINAGGSYVFGGSKSYGGGTLDSGVVKAGFVFKLGELNKPTQISFNDKKLINKKISTLEQNNKNLKAAVEESKAKNNKIISQNQKLLARLEKLENIALKLQSNSNVISMSN